MHDKQGELTYQPYGKEGQAIYSVSRGKINATMMDIAENVGNAIIQYNHECHKVDFENSIAFVRNTITGKDMQVKSDLIFASDGAFSAVRYNSMQKLPRFNYNQRFIEDGYREILLPANPDGSYKMDKNALHIWPRGRFMMIALANEDGSFTGTLFMPHENHKYAFDKLKTKEDVDVFFKDVFPDFYEMMPSIGDAWQDHPLSSLAIIRCYPWTHGKVALMGDSAHATVPFYGQGMNSGFEDCTVLNDLMIKHNENWEAVFNEYNETRKPDGDALQDLSLDNYYEMRDYVADEGFLLRKKIEAKYTDLYPKKWLPLYSQVTFSTIPYHVAYNQGKIQDSIMDEVMNMPNIDKVWDSEEVMSKIAEKSQNFNFEV
jgi:kynurenine 3-monooxygenase